ncbi:MAG: DUF177 domain-containing protein [Bacillota bacterium]|jgi:uncharacterized protein|nr:DUF177 domain-containing protein [Bacillota bacterium]NLL26842.1 DUF177 domain-containing protein [Erysipelotrichia bacterium]
MKYSRTDLLQLKDYRLTIDEDIAFTQEVSRQFPRIRKINDINVKADGIYDPNTQQLAIHFEIRGSVVVGCDVTFEDVIVPIDTEADEIFTFDKKEEDVNILKANGEVIELLPTVLQLILIEIPIKVVKSGRIEYPKGDGWEVISEETYQKQKEKRVDPRLAKLKELLPQDE